MSPTATTSPDTDAADTKERLLQAGMEIFAERGFADASVRSICARAGANTAAVNYHFGDKQSLYSEVLATCHSRAVKRRPMPRLADDPEHPEIALRAFIRWFLELLLVDGAGPLGKLMAREMADPTAALDELVRRSIMPIMLGLQEILEALLPAASPRRRRLIQHSVMGQCLFYRHTEAAMSRFLALAAASPMPRGLIERPSLDELAQHITEFSLDAVRAVIARPDATPTEDTP